jgi:hypothetical protein
VDHRFCKEVFQDCFMRKKRIAGLHRSHDGNWRMKLDAHSLVETAPAHPNGTNGRLCNGVLDRLLPAFWAAPNGVCDPIRLASLAAHYDSLWRKADNSRRDCTRKYRPYAFQIALRRDRLL